MHAGRLFRCLLVLLTTPMAITPLTTYAAPAEAGAWTVTGSMHQPRGFQATTLLANGLVLVAGGWSTNGPTADAELYHPHTGSWASTGSMHQSRFEYTATLLRDGRVLVAGGYSINGPIAGAELYDPHTGIWTITGSMHEPRIYHTATLLPDGRVLVTGGAAHGAPQHALGCVMQYAESYNGTCSGITAEAEIYDPRTGIWTLTSPMHHGRARATATLLSNGLVMVAGGAAGGANMASANPLSGAELYNPRNGTWTVTGSMHIAAGARGATLLHNGLVLVNGGFNNTGTITDAELYDARTGTWTVTGSLHSPRSYRTGQTATLLESGQVLVAGGVANSCSSVVCTGVLAGAELYNQGTGIWTVTGSLHEARAWQPATLLATGQVLVAGGSSTNDGSTALADAEIYQP
jgi:N-acetylneuraminic acid mutarotase